ncbi:AraC family transcriptional regulator [Paraburkholderia saeva]|uniref:HTH-type transcriptional regulator MtrA n=1 Tax=Paraburkholderia saeva TaxID=2777537 RepID=A0A9N8RYZ3_9BURK|nr:AraC family transcriptional regulator [Paraburkholderia saeva]CAG4889330.1 HTH-type transcriptional regulator MtrA [Paraburkholderia saeva]CAG4904138.1 HTH-type transcriptional regulator MtrA [Paraburkholderia saeva]CAG4915097.1 HTH-type transcriptional regulator MtrA [Paraburkholderia saeva]
MQHTADKLADWLLSSLELKSTIFHVGQYCGTWQASTAGRQLASFHVVLHGECWLHLPASAEREAHSLRLSTGDAVFLLRDMPHCLSPDPHPPARGHESERFGSMSPLVSPAGTSALAVGGVGIACGFFEFNSALDDMLLSLLPDHIVARRDNPSLDGARAVFELVRAEALRNGQLPSPVISRLTDLLFVYALRALRTDDEIDPCFWSLMRCAEFAPLVTAIIESPGERWTTDTMATFAHMSRARFCKHFVEISGQPPAQFVTLIRMKLAAAMLRSGARTPDAAERVGYQSESAFSQAFKRVTGVQPGAWRRASIAHDAVDMQAAAETTSAAALH